MQALKTEYEHPTIYQQLRISIGAQGSQRSSIILRAQPHAYGSEPWYDFVEVLVSEKRGNDPDFKAAYAAQLICFLDITRKARTVSTEELAERVDGPDSDDGDDDDTSSTSSSTTSSHAPSEMASSTSMLALVKFHINALTLAERRNHPDYVYHDMSITHKTLPFAIVKEDPNPRARYGLIDTEQIQQGLWVQEDFETPGRFWVLK